MVVWALQAFSQHLYSYRDTYYFIRNSFDLFCARYNHILGLLVL